MMTRWVDGETLPLWAEIDVSVSKLLCFEAFANFFRVSVSVSENLVLKKKSQFWIQKLWSRKKKVSVSENLVLKKSLSENLVSE